MPLALLSSRVTNKSIVGNRLEVMETGIGGINIIQEMLLGYEGLILVDAFEERLPPGTLRVLEPVVEDLALNSQQQRDYFADTHYATPTRVLQF